MDNGTKLQTLGEVERAYIISVLNHHDGNKTQAAKTLRIGIRTLQRKLKRFHEQGYLFDQESLATE